MIYKHSGLLFVYLFEQVEVSTADVDLLYPPTLSWRTETTTQCPTLYEYCVGSLNGPQLFATKVVRWDFQLIVLI